MSNLQSQIDALGVPIQSDTVDDIYREQIARLDVINAKLRAIIFKNDETIQHLAARNITLQNQVDQLTRANAELRNQLDVARCWAKRWKAYAKGCVAWGDK